MVQAAGSKTRGKSRLWIVAFLYSPVGSRFQNSKRVAGFSARKVRDRDFVPPERLMVKTKRRVNVVEIGPGSIVEMSDQEYIVDRYGALRTLAKKEKPKEKPIDPTRR